MVEGGVGWAWAGCHGQWHLGTRGLRQKEARGMCHWARTVRVGVGAHGLAFAVGSLDIKPAMLGDRRLGRARVHL